MRFATTIAMGVLLSAMCVPDVAAQPAPCDTCQSCNAPQCGCAGHGSDCCCDGICKQAPPNPLAPGRPSPPPCCADGVCYPNYETWGHYKTRWRRWPIELAATTPPGAQPAPPALRPDVPTYDALPPEEEDRRAPPPSAPRGKPVEIAPRKAPQEGDEEKQPTPPQTAPETEQSPESIFGLPPEDTLPETAPSLDAPTEEAPTTAPLVPPAGGESPMTTPLGEPMGDEDLPPALPFTAPKLSNRPAVRSSVQPAPASRKSEVRSAPQDDPPPALPSVLASMSR